jgi:cytochrome c biogenesis protein
LTSTAPTSAPARRPPSGPAPALSVPEFLRWIWRQLTSMRVALMLLFLLALAAIPGSIIPQRSVNPVLVDEFAERNPELSRWYERLGLFDVFSAPWFAAIYLALLVSLIGCILPRSLEHWRAMRARPPRTPSRLERLPAHESFEADVSADEALDAAAAELQGRRFRLDRRDGSVAAEIGHLRETGNLVFHLALVVVLLAVAVGALFGYRGTVIVPEKGGFANLPVQYDNLSRGPLFDDSSLPPFALDLDEFRMEFYESGPSRGAPENFEALVRLEAEPGAEPVEETIRVNDPLNVDGTLIHVLNPGYAPALTVRDADGNILAEGPVPFLPQDDTFTSAGVRKVPVGEGRGLGEDIGIDARFYPTAVGNGTGLASAFPGAANPVLELTAYHGDLGIDDGTSQSVYRLDTSEMTSLETAGGDPFVAVLELGETVELPGGYGSVTFDGYVTWVNLQISRSAGKEVALAGALLAVAGLIASLYVRRRRVWVKVGSESDGRTVVEVAGLAKSESGDLGAEVSSIADALRNRLDRE